MKTIFRVAVVTFLDICDKSSLCFRLLSIVTYLAKQNNVESFVLCPQEKSKKS